MSSQQAGSFEKEEKHATQRERRGREGIAYFVNGMGWMNGWKMKFVNIMNLQGLEIAGRIVL